MSAFVLIIGKELSISPVEACLSVHEFNNYICVEDINTAEWMMREGCDRTIVVLDQTLFESKAECDAWVKDTGLDKVIITSRGGIHSYQFATSFAAMLASDPLERPRSVPESALVPHVNDMFCGVSVH
jgi:hypothetical protein